MDLPMIIAILVAVVISAIYVLVEYFTKDKEPFDEEEAKDRAKYFNEAAVRPLGICSKTCCANYWVTSVPPEKDRRVDTAQFGKTLFPSNITCNDGIRAGCVCLSKANVQGQ